ncbi:MAG: hypothetical protein ACR2PX_27675 [Endozoicomonas sp.]|uniref:hypothetical protein n=1 Tax=Endozoicomonas sp. TaxID=1892382 RepID=UPI003D9B1228
MSRFTRGFALLFAVALIIGETLVVLKTNKYWPLSLDDYLASVALIGMALLGHRMKAQFLLPVVWAFICGNLYAMLFTRLDPVTGSGERIGLLVVALSAAVAGLVSSVIAVRKQATETQ